MELFEQPASAPGPAPPGPLADRMRPRTLDEIVGQEHLLGPGRVLRTALERGELHSIDRFTWRIRSLELSEENAEPFARSGPMFDAEAGN